MAAGEWNYVTVVFDREPTLDTAYFYLNGDPVGSESDNVIAGDSASSTIPTVWIGTNSFIGNLDEVRVSSEVRTADWIKTEFNNQTSPSTFSVLGGAAPIGVILGEHNSGQLSDQFDTSASHDNVSLFRFQLANNTDSAVTVDQIVFNLSAISGIVTNDLSDLRIFDGSMDVATGGTPSIAAATGTITFSGDFVIAANTTVNYTLRGDASNLDGEIDDTLTIALSATDIDLLAGPVSGSAPTNVTHTTDDPTEFTIQVGGSYDDAHENDSEINFKPLEPNVSIIQYISGSSSKYNGGFRFAGVDIPQGSTINSATFSGYLYSATYDEMYATLYGHAADNSPDFTAPNNHIVDTGVRPRTTASVAWGETFGSTGWKNKDVTSIVQEIDRPAGVAQQ